MPPPPQPEQLTGGALLGTGGEPGPFPPVPGWGVQASGPGHSLNGPGVPEEAAHTEAPTNVLPPQSGPRQAPEDSQP